MNLLSMQVLAIVYLNAKEQNRKLMNVTWCWEKIKKKMRKIPRSIFIQDVQDIITLLSRIARLKVSNTLEPQMFGLIEKIMEAPVQIHWGIFISNKLCAKIITFMDTQFFSMSSYDAYSHTLRENIQGLKKVGTLGKEPRNNLIYAHIPQITIYQYRENYQRVNNVFTMRLVRLMEGDKAKRLSLEAQSVIQLVGG